MKYNVKWIEDNLGITRKTLRVYEDAGIINKHAIENPNNKYREYDEDDIKYIWTIRILQGIGYTLKEIKDIIENPEYDFEGSIDCKIKKLEDEKAKIDEHLGYAKAIKMVGAFPLGLNSIGDIQTDDFISTAKEVWNIHSDEKLEAAAIITDSYLHKPQKLWGLKELEALSVVFEGYEFDTMMILKDLYNQLANLKDLSVDAPMVAEAVEKICEYSIKNFSDPDLAGITDPREVAIVLARSFSVGDISLVEKEHYGEEACEFMALAMARFAGFDDINGVL